MKTIFTLSGFIALSLLVASQAQAVNPQFVWRDMNKDGFLESKVFYSTPKMISKIEVYSSADRKLQGVVYYQSGVRSRAVFSTNGDNRPSKWLSYDHNGEIWKTAEDLNSDGRPDYWEYYQNGEVYLTMRDRNGDGKPDMVTIYKIEPGRSAKIVRTMMDNDFDGLFEIQLGTPKPYTQSSASRPIPTMFVRPE